MSAHARITFIARVSFTCQYHALSALILIPLLAIPLVAQQPADTIRTAITPEVVVEALRTPFAIDSVPYSLSIVEPGTAGAGRSLDEVLVVPGVQVDNRFNYAVGDRISIRGFGARTQFGVRGIRVVADGIPATFADGQSALETIDPAEIDRAEVIRGPASALYGNASGGVMLLRSSTPPSEPLRGSASLTAGGYGLLRTGAHLGGTSGPAIYQLSFSRLASDGYRMHSDARFDRVRGDVGYRTNDSDRLWLSGAYVDFSADNPGALSQALLAADPRQAFSGNVRQHTGKSGHQLQGGLGWNHEMGWGRMDIKGYLIDRDITNPIAAQVIELGRTAAGAGLLLHGDLRLAGLPINWSAGADLALQFDNRQNFRNDSGSRGPLMLDQAERVVGGGSFITLLFPLNGSLHLMGSMRYDQTLFHVQDRLITAGDPDDSGDRTMDAVSPSLGLIWMPAESFTLYGNLATAFETPTTTELANRPDGAGGFNPDLQPQRARSFEAGARGRVGRLMEYGVALYTIDITDELIPFQVPGVPDRDYFRNAGTSRHQGVEGSLTLTPVSGASLRAGFSYTDARYESFQVDDKVYDGNRVPGIAPWRADVAAAYLASAGWYAQLSGRGVDRIPVDDANSESAAGYALFNLRLGYVDISFGPADGAWSYTASLYAGIDNLFDTRYTASVTVNAFGGRYYEPGAGRTPYAGVGIGIGRRSR